MNKALPLISVGIPVYNGEKYLQNAVDSVLRQDYENFELIISDNASTDATHEICSEYAAKDKRVRYVRNQVNIGAVPNFNRVFDLARGEFFKWLSHDDECYPTMLRRCAELLDGAPDSVVLVYTLCEMIDANGNFRGPLIEDVKTSAPRPDQRLRRVLFKRTSAQALCGLIRSRYLRQTRLRGSFVKDDCALLAELSMLGAFWEIPEVLLKIRIHPANAVRSHASLQSFTAWLDPANSGKAFVLPPEITLVLEGFRSVGHLPLRPVDRILCYMTALAYCVRPLTAFLGPIRDFAGRQKARLLKSCRT